MVQKSEFEKIATLLENSMALPHDVFDYQSRMHADVTAHLEKVINLAKERFIPFLKCKIEDVVLFGKLCSSVHRSHTKADIAFVVQTNLPAQTLENITLSIPARGYRFFIYNHEIVFHLLKKEDVMRANWSIVNKKWNQEPEIRQFSFNLNHLAGAYDLYAKETHDILDHLPKTTDGFYTPESCEKIRQYLKYLKDTAIFALKNHPEHEYSMAYNLYLAFDEVLGIKAMFEASVAASESHILGNPDDI